MDDEKTPVEAPAPGSESAEQHLPLQDAGGGGGLGGLSSGKEPWRSGGGCGRLPLAGCAIGIVLLIAALVIGVSLVRRSVWMTVDRTRQQVVQGLPFQLPPGERLRMTRNLERFRTILETSPDPYPMMGEFVNRVRAAFEDGRFTAEEIEELNLFLEGKIEESGMPGMQLDAGMRNEE